MLRYFYLLCLVIYIKECYCFDSINDGNSKLRPLGKRFKRKGDPNSGSLYKINSHIIRRRQEYDNSDDNDQLAQIDVASFIQQPDPYADEELFFQPDDLNSQLMSKNKDYGFLPHLDSDHANDENIKWKSNHNPALFKDGMYSNMEASPLKYNNNDFQFNKFNNIFDNKMSEDNLVHNPIKKSPTQHKNRKLRFPFFFHRKSNVSNITEINDSTSKQHFVMDFSNLTGYENIDKPFHQHIKMTHRNNVCTKCKNEKRGIGQSIIHNSRQYYQKKKGDNKNKMATKPQLQNTELVTTKESDKHKLEGNKFYEKRHKKANMRKYKEKDTVRKKPLGWKEFEEPN